MTHIWLSLFGDGDVPGGGYRYPIRVDAHETLIQATKARTLDLLSDDAHAALRQAGLLS
jgi:hypothetical protein